MIELTYRKWGRDNPQVRAVEDWNAHLDVLNAISGVNVNATFITDANETVTLPSASRHRNLSGVGDAQLHVPRRHAPTHFNSGIDGFVHAPIHSVGASDPLRVGVPSNIGNANAEGAQANFVRRDHVHNHPAGLGADLHHPQIHAPTHSGGGTDPIAIGAGQITSGVLPLPALPAHAVTHSGADADPVVIDETQIRSPGANADQLLIYSGSGWEPGDPWLGGYFPVAAIATFTGECFTERWEQGFRPSLYRGRTGSYWQSESYANTPFTDWTLPDVISGANPTPPAAFRNAVRVRNSQDNIVLDECYIGLYKSMKRGVLAWEGLLPSAPSGTGLYAGFEVVAGGSFAHLACLYSDGTNWTLRALSYNGLISQNIIPLRHSGVFARYALIYDPPVLEMYQAPVGNPVGFPLQLTNTVLIGENNGQVVPFFASEDDSNIFEMQIGSFWAWETPAMRHHFPLYSGVIGAGGSSSDEINCAGINELAVTFRGHYNVGAVSGARVFLRGGWGGEYTNYVFHFDDEHIDAAFYWFDPRFEANITSQTTRAVQGPYPHYLNIAMQNKDSAQTLPSTVIVHVKGSDY